MRPPRFVPTVLLVAALGGAASPCAAGPAAEPAPPRLVVFEAFTRFT